MFILSKAKRRKAYGAVQKSVKFPSETAHFTKDTTASRLKKVEKQKTMAKGEMKSLKKTDGGTEDGAGITVVSGHAETRNEPGNRHEINDKLREHEIHRYTSCTDQDWNYSSIEIYFSIKTSKFLFRYTLF